MRIPHSKVWRAFPEFDRFSDESCRAFVQRVSRIGPRAARMWAATILVGGIGLTAMYLLLARIRESVFHDPHIFDTTTPGLVLLSVLMISSGVMTGLVVRDVVLRLELRRLIGSSAQCPRCGYLRIGLYIDESCVVRCPECALVAELDPQTIKTSVGVDGKRVIVDANFEASRIRIPRWILIWCMRGAFAVIATAALLVASVIMVDRRNARLAAELKPSDAEWEASRGARGGVVEEFRTVATLRQAVAVSAIRSTAREAWNLTVPVRASLPPEIELHDLENGFLWVAQGSWRAPQDPETPSHPDLPPSHLDVRQSEDLGRRMLAVLRSAGLLEQVDALEEFIVPTAAAATLAIDDPDFSTVPWSIMMISAINVARMSEAIRLGDDEELVRVFRSSLGAWAFSQRQIMHPHVADRLLRPLCFALASVRPGMSREVLEELDRAAALALANEVPPRLLIELEILRHREVVSRDLLAFDRWQAIKSRRWRGSPGWSGYAISVEPGAMEFIGVGGLKNELDAVDDVFLDGDTLRPMSSWRRELILGNSGADLGCRCRVAIALRSTCRLMLVLRGLRVLVAIERYRLDNGRLPETLADLPGGAASDPLNGLAFGYRRLDPATDEQGRDFVLYSLGLDGVDAGGSMGSENSFLRAMTLFEPFSSMLDVPLNSGPKMRSPMLKP